MSLESELFKLEWWWKYTQAREKNSVQRTLEKEGRKEANISKNRYQNNKNEDTSYSCFTSTWMSK